MALVKDMMELIERFTKLSALLTAVFWLVVFDGLLADHGNGLLHWLRQPLKQLPSLVLGLSIERVLITVLFAAFLWLIALPVLGALWTFIRWQLPDSRASHSYPDRAKGYVSLPEAKRIAAETDNSVLNARCRERERQNEHDDRLRQLILALPIAAWMSYFTAADGVVTIIAELFFWIGNLSWIPQSGIMLSLVALLSAACTIVMQADSPLRNVIWLERKDKNLDGLPPRYVARSRTMVSKSAED